MPAVTRDKEDSVSPLEDELQGHPCIAWSGISRKIPVFLFYAEAILAKDGKNCTIGEKYNLAFKIVRTESRLVRGMLVNHGFHEVHPNSNDFNLMWSGSHLKNYLLRTLWDFQKVNHFPRSYELTRKDRLYRNIQRMQEAHSFQNFHIVPQTFVLPHEYQEFCNYFSKDKGPWIVKPVASSRGRGIYLISNPSHIPLNENILVSRYISNPLLIDGFKFDVRLYVLVTSYDPIIIYLYEEGLARFATVKYDHAVKNIKNQFMHLTNYSVNKKSSDYVSCNDPEVEDYGNKWSMSAVLRYLKQEGKDITLLMGQIEDLIIKTVLSAEIQIATACKMFVPYRNNCFELYGFDVLIDSNLKPWLLEVNLSPSLACDAPLDLKIKASMISDMFSIVGFVCQDPVQKQPRSDKTQRPFSAQSASARPKVVQRPLSCNYTDPEEQKEKQGVKLEDTLGLTAEEIKVLRRTQEENERRGGFIRIFPTEQTWELYSGYLEYKTSMNSMLANKLFHGRAGKTSVTSQSSRMKLKGNVPVVVEAVKTTNLLQYERKLLTLEARRPRRRHMTGAGKGKTGRRPSSSSPHTSENEEVDPAGAQGLQETQAHKASSAHSDPQATVAERLQVQEYFPARLHKPRVDLLYLLHQGWDLSKVQARMAFSSYLHLVQMRLLAESRESSSSACSQKDSDQMELVMRFLKKAASNLQQDMQVVLPSPQLSLPDRRRILSHQLGEFIHCYNKETEHIVKNMEKVREEDRRITSSVFQEFILQASESDLEEILTFYTHKTKSASVFLGTKNRSSRLDSRGTEQAAKQHSKEEDFCASKSLITSVGNSKTGACNTDSRDNSVKSREGKCINGHPVIEVQPEVLATSEIPNGESKMRSAKETISGNDRSLSQPSQVSASEPELVRGCNSQARIQACQHTSSYPAALDCEQIHLQHFPKFPSEPLLKPQPPPYVQPPPHPHAEPQNQSQNTASSTDKSLQPARVMWASSRNGFSRPVVNAEAQQSIPYSRSTQLSINGVSMGVASAPCTINGAGQKLSRPSSAGQVSHKASKPRPGSAGVLKEPDVLSVQAQSNQQAIVLALKKLVEKQAARQYSTSSHISLLTQHLTNLNLASGVFGRGGISKTPAVLHGTARSQRSDMNLPSAMGFESVADEGWPDPTTEVTPHQSYQPSIGSYQLQFAIQQLQQQKLQSRQLLEQSRLRHQALLGRHTLVPDVLPRNSVSANSSCGVQVSQHSQYTPNLTVSLTAQSQPNGLGLPRGATALNPKPPSSTPRDGTTRKSAAQRIQKQPPSEASSSNGMSSRQHVVYDTLCGKPGLSVYSKLFQTQGSGYR